MEENDFLTLSKTHPIKLVRLRTCISAHKVYEGEWQAKTQQELVCRIQSQPKKFDWSNFLQNLMGNVKTKLRAITDRGVLAT